MSSNKRSATHLANVQDKRRKSESPPRTRTRGNAEISNTSETPVRVASIRSQAKARGLNTPSPGRASAAFTMLQFSTSSKREEVTCTRSFAVEETQNMKIVTKYLMDLFKTPAVVLDPDEIIGRYGIDGNVLTKVLQVLSGLGVAEADVISGLYVWNGTNIKVAKLVELAPKGKSTTLVNASRALVATILRFGPNRAWTMEELTDRVSFEGRDQNVVQDVVDVVMQLGLMSVEAGNDNVLKFRWTGPKLTQHAIITPIEAISKTTATPKSANELRGGRRTRVIARADKNINRKVVLDDSSFDYEQQKENIQNLGPRVPKATVEPNRFIKKVLKIPTIKKSATETAKYPQSTTLMSAPAPAAPRQPPPSTTAASTTSSSSSTSSSTSSSSSLLPQVQKDTQTGRLSPAQIGPYAMYPHPTPDLKNNEHPASAIVTASLVRSKQPDLELPTPSEMLNYQVSCMKDFMRRYIQYYNKRNEGKQKEPHPIPSVYMRNQDSLARPPQPQNLQDDAIEKIRAENQYQSVPSSSIIAKAFDGLHRSNTIETIDDPSSQLHRTGTSRSDFHRMGSIASTFTRDDTNMSRNDTNMSSFPRSDTMNSFAMVGKAPVTENEIINTFEAEEWPQAAAANDQPQKPNQPQISSQ